MHEAKRTRLKLELSHHYKSQQADVPEDAIEAIVTAMLAEDVHGHEVRHASSRPITFVASQVRYIPTWTWVTQAALVVLMFVVARSVGDVSSTKVAVGILSAMAVLVGVPTVQASKANGVAELEYACPHNASSVMVARLIVLGCSSSLAVAIMVGITAATVNAAVFHVALWACPPFFLSCAGSLLVLRKAHPSAATTLCAAWTASCITTLLALANALPNLYAGASLAAWASAATAALAWLIREVALTFRAASAGLDAFAPHMARTYH